MSRRLFRISILSFQLVLLLSLLLSAGAVSVKAQAKPLISNEINDQVLTRLAGNTHPLATTKNDRGVVSPSRTLQRMLLVLKRPAAQDKALATAIEAMHQPNSPTFHHWLTPDQIGAKYGPAQADIQKVVSWLGSQGLTVTSVSKAHSTIEFSGTARAFSAAFHTEIHTYAHQGGLYTANASDPSVPSALAPVVAGFASLNNFPRSHISSQPSMVKFDKQTKKWSVSKPKPGAAPGAKPEFTTVYDGQTFYPVTPADFATIYNLKPLYDQGIDGTGQHIAVVSESNINTADVDAFRSAFGLPPTKLNIILNGDDPGPTIADGVEPSIDAEWAGAIAKNATIDFVISKTTDTSQGIDLSAQYIVDNQVAPVLSESYGYCEIGLGNAGNLFYYQLWQQAAAQGITAVLSAGDSGAATCDQNQPVAQFGDTVSGYASTPYTVTVGGTDFAVSTTDPNKYWNSQNDPATFGSALSYIPEIPWNSSCASPNINAVFGGNFGANSPEQLCNNPNASVYLNAVGGGGGASNCVQTDPSNPYDCLSGYPQPSWQKNINGIADGTARYVPDVSLFAANGAFGSFYLFCEADITPNNVCDYTDPNSIVYFGEGGTSFGAPAFASIMALVNQKTNSSQGVANYVLYDLGRKQYGTTSAPNTKATTACNASAGPGQDNTCTFYDVTEGSNAEPCLTGSVECVTNTPSDQVGILAGYTSNSGYDAVTGLGSVNVTNLVNNWKAETQTGTTTSLSLSPTHFTYGAATIASGTVSASNGTPTGEVILQAAQQSFGAIQLATGSFSQGISILPAGSYSATASYLGDGIFSKSISTAVPLTIDKAASSGTLTFSAINPRSGAVLSTTNQIPYGSMIVGTFTVQGVTGVTGIQAPTGTVSFTDSGSSVGQNAISGSTATADEIAGVPGSGTWTAVYSGDSNYLPTANLTGSYTVVKANTTLEAHPSIAAVTGSNSVTLNANITSLSYAAPPMGTVTFSINGTSVGTASVIPGADPATSAGLGSATLTIPSSQLTSGNNVLTASYSGNDDFNTSNSGQSSILYSSGPLTSGVTLTASSTTATNTSPVTLAAAVNVSSTPATAGIVTFLDGATVLARVPVVGVNAASGSTTGTARLVTLLPDGTHTLTAVYGGISGVIPASTSSSATVTVTGTLPTTTSLSAAHNALFPANYDFTAQVFAGGTTIPTGNVSINEPSLGGTLGQLTLDPTTAVKGLAPEESLQIGGTPQEVLTADFNGDGILDLAVSRDYSLDDAGNFGEGQPQLQIFLGKGDGTFATGLPSVITNDPNIAGPDGIATGDFNGDGIPDIAFGFQFGGNITILLGKGDGTFTNGPFISIPGGFPVLNNLVIDDFNGDGVQDIAFTDLGGSDFGVALGNGDGSFQAPQTTHSVAPNRIATADVNHDGKPDLVLLHPFSNSVAIALGNGDGTFQTEVSYGVTGQTPWGLATGDLNHDGFIDIVTADQGDGTVAVVLNNGDGTYGTAVTYSVGAFPQYVTIGDINHDGIPDLIAANNSDNSLTILYGQGDGTFKQGVTLKTGLAPITPLVADLNNDGIPDLIVNENQAGTTGVFLNGITLTGTQTNIAVDGAVTEKQSVSATYAGDTTYAASTGAALTLAGSGATTPTKVTWTPATTSGTYGTAIPAGLLNAQVTGKVTGTITYTTQTPGAGVTPVTATTILPAAGVYSLTATFIPTSAADYATSSALTTFTVNKATVSQTLTASATQVAPGAAMTFTDVVTSSTSGTPTGVVNFFSGSSSIGAATLDSTGHASLTTTSLPAGAASITASYLGDNNFTTATVNGPSITIGVPGFLLSLDSAKLGVTAGSSATVTLAVAPSLQYTGNVVLSCGNLPLGMSCSFSPASGQISGSPLQSTLTLASAGPSTSTAQLKGNDPWLAIGGGTSLACLALLLVPIRANRRLRGLLMLVFCAGLVSIGVGCGGSSSSANTTLKLTTGSTKAASGTAVALNASVGGSHASNATGTVTFFDGATQLGQPVTVASGRASLSVQSLSVGTHTITATYTGDSHNSAASSGALQQVITGETSVQIVAVSGTETQTANLQVTLQ
jgi:hypothetical protein